MTRSFRISKKWLMKCIRHGAALISRKPQNIICNPGGNFKLFRVGVAVDNRYIHSAIYKFFELVQGFVVKLS
ncbi:MAG: hypothetical protein QMC48_00965 [SAR324 cluster bacterium]